MRIAYEVHRRTIENGVPGPWRLARTFAMWAEVILYLRHCNGDCAGPWLIRFGDQQMELAVASEVPEDDPFQGVGMR